VDDPAGVAFGVGLDSVDAAGDDAEDASEQLPQPANARHRASSDFCMPINTAN